MKGKIEMSRLFHWHWLSHVTKAALGLVVLLLSGILSYTFFTSIEPVGMDVFPFAALTLTEGGFVGWLLIFTTMKHHPIKGLIAVIMIILSFVTTVVVTFAELIVIFQDHTLVSNDTVKNGTLLLLEFMLGMHVLAAASDFLIGKIEWLLSELPSLHRDVQIVEADDSPALPQSVHPQTSVQPVPQPEIDYVKLAQTMQALQQPSDPLASPVLDPNQASQTGQNGHGH